MQHKEFFIETKFDGERVQIHKNENTYSYFSRKCVRIVAATRIVVTCYSVKLSVQYYLFTSLTHFLLFAADSKFRRCTGARRLLAS